MTNLYKVSMSKPGLTFYVAAKNETDACRAAERQWEKWDYLRDVKPVAVHLIGFGEQYPPDGIDWFIMAGKAHAA